MFNKKPVNDLIRFHDDSFDDFEQAIPLLSDEEEREMNESGIPKELPILPLKNTVLFPGVVIPITVGRDKSLSLVKNAYESERIIGIVTQKEMDKEDPDNEDLYHVGTVAQILKLIKMPDGSKSIVIQGKRVIKIREFTQIDPYFKATVDTYPNEMDLIGIELDASLRSIKETAAKIINLSPNIPSEASIALENINSPTFLLNFIASNLNISLAEKQHILEIQTFSKRLKKIADYLIKELQVLNLSEEIRSKVKTDIDQQQRDFYLRQQMKAIQEALGEDGDLAEVEKLRETVKKKNFPKHAKEKIDKQLTRLERTPSSSPNHGIILNHIEWILDLPWESYSKDKLDLKRARKILDEDHYGLDKIKKRIIEYLAVLKLKKDMKAPILCLVGPPGVGKTSLGKSVARSIDREFVRFSLGGLHDESEIRGHRRTYIGALPGRIIQNMKKAGTGNPVMMLDEIDKVGSDYRGDPTSALLEVLDPEQNNTFYDNYLELEYDLSKVLFIATANSLYTIPPPLRDRMEIIILSGYTLQEKLQIAKKFLVPRNLEENGVNKSQFKISDKAIELVIESYTRESGVRNLFRELSSIVRGVAIKIASEESDKVSVGIHDIETYLGKRKFYPEVAERTNVPGVSTGLAWTPVGGDILFIEASVSPGNGKLNLTGQLGDVMKESALLALSYLKTNAGKWNIPKYAFTDYDLHVHVPAGAIPKDGPSAGVSMLAAMTSIFTQRKVKHTVAMTGEITLRGLVLPVGGLKEKVLAAKRAGIKMVILPKRNEADINEIEKDIMGDLKVEYVDRMESFLSLVLDRDAVNNPHILFAKRSDKTSPNGSSVVEESVTANS